MIYNDLLDVQMFATLLKEINIAITQENRALSSFI